MKKIPSPLPVSLLSTSSLLRANSGLVDITVLNYKEWNDSIFLVYEGNDE
jgi:hypothetical protein